jgi:YD repeat-containing protein
MRRELCAALLSLAIVPSALAQHSENFERGFAPGKAYHFSDFDHVNLFNGNLTVTIPIGDSYPLGGGSSYALTLVYNSQIWEFNEVTPISPDNPPCCEPWAFPNRRSNAGLGWMLSLGRYMPIYDPSNQLEAYAFESPDGADHRLNQQIGPDAESTDGSYLRWHPSTQTLDSPDGSQRTFWGDGYLRRMTDAFGNHVDVQELFYPDGSLASWHITDNVGRSHWVYFKIFGGTTNFNAQTNYKTVVDRVELQTAGGTVVYQFVYANDSGVVDQPTTVGESCLGYATGYPTEYNLPLLRRIDLPDGSSYSGMTYGDTLGTCAQGVLTSVTVPTKAQFAWGYGTWVFPQDACDEHGWLHSTSGVRTRTLSTPEGASLGTWSYQNHLDDIEYVGCAKENRIGTTAAAQSVATTVTSPTGNKEVHWFTGWPRPFNSSNGISDAEYGHPQARARKDPNGPAYLAGEEYDCSSGACPSAPTRRTYIRYVTDGTAEDPDSHEIVSVLCPNFCNEFSRIELERNYYENGTIIAQEHSDFDGFGHFRKTVTGAPPLTAGTSRTAYTNYNPGTDSNGYRNGVFAFASNVPWILGTFSEQWVSEAGHSAKSLACFESTTGYLQRLRTLKGDAADPASILPASDDLLGVFTRDGAGNTTDEAYYGGDARSGVGALGTTDLCSLGLPSAQYEIRHGYANGVRASTQYYDGVTPMPFKSLDRDVHLSGTVTAERDVTGLGTTLYSYDTAGRLSSVTPSGSAAVTYSYTNASYAAGIGFAPAEIHVSRGDTSSRVQFDSLGRVWREFRTMPDIGEVRRETSYDMEGRKTSISAWDTSTTPRFLTTYSYDGFGRPLSVTPPDGSAHATTFSYSGVTGMTRTTRIGTAAGVETPVNTTESYDVLGRLISVAEDPANGTGTVATNYTYDVGNRLASVTMYAGATPQVRRFNYDSRGFLTSEQHPEVGMAGNGIVTYTEYDARGHAHRRLTGATDSSFDTVYTYDSAERLTRIDQLLSRQYGTTRPLKEFLFGVANSTNNYVLGRLQQATRHNYVSALGGDFAASETYSYDVGGRVLSKATDVSGPGGVSQHFTQSYSYNALGLIAMTTYPTCVPESVCGASPLPSVSPIYQNGVMTGVPNFASTITYGPTGLIGRISHSGTAVVNDDVIADLNGLARPRQITFSYYDGCVRPLIGSQSSSQTIASGTALTLRVDVTAGTTLPVAYQWFKDGVLLPNETSLTLYTGALTSTTTFVARVINSCGRIDSSPIVLTVCSGSPTINVQPQDATRSSGQSAALWVDANGCGTLSYQWYKGFASDTTLPVGQNSNMFDTGPLTATARYWVRARDASTNAFTDSRTAVVTIALGAPTGLNAAYIGGNQIQVSWNGVVGADHYILNRRSAFGTQDVTVHGTSYIDAGLNAGATYVYHVHAVDAFEGSASGDTANDLATTMTFSAIQQNVTTITFDQFDAVLRAVNAVRAAAGWSAVTWSSIMPMTNPPTPVPARGGMIFAAHVIALRNSMDDALRGVQVGVGSYTDSLATLTRIRAVHISELQERAQ